MRMSLRQPKVFLLLVALGVTAPALAGRTTDIAGDWSGNANARVRVRRVGGDRDTVFNNVTVHENGTWESSDAQGWDFSGTWSPNGKKITYAYDADGRAELKDMLESWALDYGYDATVTIGAIKSSAKAVVNRRGTTLKSNARVSFTVAADGATRSGTYKVATKLTPD